MTRQPSGNGVLVLDTSGQCGLSVVRSLGRKDISVTAGARAPRSLGMLSRYSDDSFVYPDPRSDADGFLDALIAHLDRVDYDAVIPADDHSSLLLARHKPDIRATGTTAAVEDWPTFERAYDKAKLFETVATLDIPAPVTALPTSMGAVARLADEIAYPAVIKPRSKSHFRDGECVTTLVTGENYVDSPQELRQTYRQFLARYDGFDRWYPIVQEVVPGTTTTTVVLADDGEILQFFQEERVRTYPATGGNSALLEAVENSVMLEYTERVLAHLGWTGPAMVEFMRTPDGTYFLIEVNGRYWGSLPFAINCGFDVPWLHYLQLQGHDPSPLIERGDYRTDIRQRRLLYEDLKWFGEHLSEGNIDAVRPFLAAFVRSRHTGVSVNDPLPTLGALAQAAKLGTGAIEQRVRQSV